MFYPTHLTLGYMFNQKIHICNIEHLIFGNKTYYYNIKKNLLNEDLMEHKKFINNTVIPNHIKIIYY